MKYMDTLFVNKSLKCFKSLFAKKTQFKNIINLANKYIFLFQSRTLITKNVVRKVSSDYILLKNKFFHGENTKKDKSGTKTKLPIWDEMYWYFLIIANFINKSKDIASLNDGMHGLLLNYSFNYCYQKILIILRTIFNKGNYQKDDISIWNLKSLKTEQKYEKWLDSLYKQSKFRNFVNFINKRIVHITVTYKKPFWINSAFNIFEALYIITKIIFWENRPKNTKYWTYNIHWDADSEGRYDGDLLNIDKLKHSEKLWCDDYEKNYS